jgi:hemolysin III
MDHAMIHVLIASTYTPVCLIPLRGVWGWSLLGMIWSLAIFGILLKIFWKNLPDWFSVTFYIFMGWLSVVAIWPMIQTLQIGALVWIFIGGFFYTFGAIIHSLKKPNPIPNVVGAHEIFHLFVLLGSAAHFWVMYNYITKFS